MPGTSFKIDSPALSWSEDGLPRSTHFDDIYYSRQDALAESDHVFLKGCELTQLWSDPALAGSTFTMGEIGFGGGLNFLQTWALWQQQTTQSSCPARLHYVAVEQYPLSAEDLALLHSRWPGLQTCSARLLENYSPKHRGLMRLHLDESVTLDLMLGDATYWLQQRPLSDPPMQAWFLDGFSPALNEALWTPQLFRLMALHSSPMTRLATYSSAGQIRRDLLDAGFNVERQDGFGSKRHMLVARGNNREPSRHTSTAPWFDFSRFQAGERQAVVIGAGLAGCFTANALARRGWRIELLDRAPDLASGASGIPQLALRCRLFNSTEPQAQFYLQAYGHSVRSLSKLNDSGQRVFHDCGVRQLASAMKSRHAPESHLVAGLYPESIVKADAQGDYLFPEGGWVDSRQLCQSLVDHPNITFRGNSAVESINLMGDTWQLHGEESADLGQYPVTIIANGFDAHHLIANYKLPLQKIIGQSSQLATSEELAVCNEVLCGDKTLLPSLNGMHTVSATYRSEDASDCQREEDDRENQEALAAMLGIDVNSLKLQQSWVGSRCNSRDRFPLVGPVPDFHATSRDYADLRRNAKAIINTPATYLPGLYLNTAHGSNGLCSSPLSAEYLASLIDGGSSPIEKDLMDALNPVRFLIQGMKKQR